MKDRQRQIIVADFSLKSPVKQTLLTVAVIDVVCSTQGARPNLY